MEPDTDLLLWRAAAQMIKGFPDTLNFAFEGEIQGKLEAGDHEGAEWWSRAQERAVVILAHPDPALLVANFLALSQPVFEALEAENAARK